MPCLRPCWIPFWKPFWCWVLIEPNDLVKPDWFHFLQKMGQLLLRHSLPNSGRVNMSRLAVDWTPTLTTFIAMKQTPDVIRDQNSAQEMWGDIFPLPSNNCNILKLRTEAPKSRCPSYLLSPPGWDTPCDVKAQQQVVINWGINHFQSLLCESKLIFLCLPSCQL